MLGIDLAHSRTHNIDGNTQTDANIPALSDILNVP